MHERDILFAALKIGSPPEREAYLARVCGENTELRSRIEALLRSAGEAGSFLEHPLLQNRPTKGHGAEPLERLGDFRILGEIGRGGMGVVYEAMQESLGRRVALKVLSRQLLDNKSCKRFSREAHAAARLHHTNIVPVFGVGEQDGVHYYVMQLIAGQPLAEVLDEVCRLRESQGEGVGPRESVPQTLWGKSTTQAVSAAVIAESIISGIFPQRAGTEEASEDSGSGDGREIESKEIESGSEPPASDETTTGEVSAFPAPSAGDPPETGRLSETARLSDPLGLSNSGDHAKGVSGHSYFQSVARIGVQAAEALAYAHQQGVLHRDVKPGNLLLDNRGTVWVADFGLAKTEDHEDLTHTGDVLGTLRYMAPEMFTGQADARSDVYSLGLTLYEMLALRPAFEERDRGKLVQMVMHESPPRLRTLEPHIPRDLETIVHKAIDRDPSHRYQTAGELAADLQRYLGNEPIRAKWVSPVTRFSRWCKRNPAIAALTTTIAFLLATAAVGSSLAAVRFENLVVQANEDKEHARAAQTRAEQAQTRAEKAAKTEKKSRTLAESERDRANINFALARRAVNTYLDDVTESHLLSVPGLQRLREKLLSSALTFYTKFTQERTDDATLLIELADAQYRLGRIHAELGDKEAGGKANAESIRLFEQLRDQQSDNLAVRVGLAHSYYWAQRYDDTVKLCQSILETEPQHAEIRTLLAETYNTLAIDDKNDIATALAYHQQAFELREPLAREFPDDPGYLAELGSTVNNLGVLLGEQKENTEALQMFERAVGYTARAYELQPHSIRWGEWLCISVRNCAYKQKDAGATEAARQSFARLVALRRDLALNNQAVTRLQAEVYRACLEQSRYEQQLGHATEANRAMREGRRILEHIPHDNALQLAELGLMYASLSQPVAGAPDETAFDADERAEFADQAAASLKAAIEAGYRNLQGLHQDKLLDPLREREDFRELLATLESLRKGEGLAAKDTGTSEEQLRNRRDALRILRDLQEQLDVRTTLAATLHSIGIIQTGLKEFDEAEEALQQTLSIRRELLQESPDDPQTRLDLLSTQVALGEVDWARGNFSKAHTQWQHCLKESAAIAAAYPDSSIVREGRLAKAENVIYGRYGRLALWPLLLEFADRTARYERPMNYGTTGYGDGQLAQGVLAANEPGATHRLLQRLARNMQAADPNSELSKYALSSLIRSAAISDVQVLPPDEMVATAQRIFAEFSDKSFMGVALAAAQYRAGEYASALDTVRPFRKQHLPFLEAAITQRLGDHEGAVTLWDDAESRYQSLCADILQHPPSQDDFLHLSAWSHDWWHFATIQAVRREAYSVIYGGAYHDPWQHLIQARGYRLIGEIEKSESELAAVASGDDPYIWLARARLLEQWGDVDRAEADWEHVVDVAGDNPIPWIRRGRWYAEQGEQEKADADFARAASLTPNELNRFLEAGWWVVGPYPANLDEFCPPEIKPDPSRPVYTINPNTGLSDKPARWREVALDPAGNLHLLEPSVHLTGSAYALAYVYSPDERTEILRVSGPPGIRIWWNGEFVYETDDWLPRGVFARRVPVALHAGRNVLLLKTAVNAELFVRVGDTPLDRAVTAAEEANWEEANRQFLLSAESDVPRDLRCEFAKIALLCGQDEIYRRECVRLFDQFAQSKNSWTGFYVAHAASFTGNPVLEEHFEEVMRLLERAITDATAHKSLKPRALHAAASACLHTKRIPDVLPYLDQIQIQDDLYAERCGWPLRAMVCEAEGKHEEALTWLARCDSYVPEFVQGNPFWPATVTMLLQYREASRIVTGSTTSVDAVLRQLRDRATELRTSSDPLTDGFDHVVLTEGRKPEPYLARGRRLAELGRFDDAEADFNRAVELAPDDPDVFIARAIFHADRGAPEAAADDLHAALQLADATDDGRSWVTRRKVALRAAIRPAVFERLVSHNKHGAEKELWHARMFVLTYDGDLAAAQQVASQLTGFQPQRAAVALLRNDRLEFERIRDSRPADWDAVYTSRLLMLAPADQPTTGELLSTARQVLDANPDDWHARVNWGIALYRDGQQPEARDQLEPLANSHLRGVVWPVLAMIHHQLGDESQARQWLQRSNDWLSWQHPGTSADAPRIFKPGVNGLEDWLRAAVFNQEAKRWIDGAPQGATDEPAASPASENNSEEAPKTPEPE